MIFPKYTLSKKFSTISMVSEFFCNKPSVSLPVLSRLKTTNIRIATTITITLTTHHFLLPLRLSPTTKSPLPVPTVCIGCRGSVGRGALSGVGGVRLAEEIGFHTHKQIKTTMNSRRAAAKTVVQPHQLFRSNSSKNLDLADS